MAVHEIDEHFAFWVAENRFDLVERVSRPAGWIDEDQREGRADCRLDDWDRVLELSARRFESQILPLVCCAVPPPSLAARMPMRSFSEKKHVIFLRVPVAFKMRSCASFKTLIAIIKGVS